MGANRRSTYRLPTRISRLAERSVNPDQLLEGEDLASTSAADAVLWQGVYGELIDFKARLLETMHDSLALISRPSVIEIRELDVALVEAQRQRYVDRLAFWQRRGRELQTFRVVADA
jgi:hypothetical protein